MTAVPDHFITDRINQALREATYHFPELKIGAYVRLRHLPAMPGRIIDLVVKNADDEAIKLLRMPYVLYKIRYLDGQIFEEHPEHLDVTRMPTPQKVPDAGSPNSMHDMQAPLR